MDSGGDLRPPVTFANGDGSRRSIARWHSTHSTCRSSRAWACWPAASRTTSTNILVGIFGNAGLALSDLPEDSPARESVQDIEQASNRSADLCRLRQIILNLVVNGSEAIGEDDGLVTVRTGVTATDDGSSRVFLEVVDTGCGMDEDTQGRMFAPYFHSRVIPVSAAPAHNSRM